MDRINQTVLRTSDSWDQCESMIASADEYITTKPENDIEAFISELKVWLICESGRNWDDMDELDPLRVPVWDRTLQQTRSLITGSDGFSEHVYLALHTVLDKYIQDPEVHQKIKREYSWSVLEKLAYAKVHYKPMMQKVLSSHAGAMIRSVQQCTVKKEDSVSVSLSKLRSFKQASLPWFEMAVRYKDNGLSMFSSFVYEICNSCAFIEELTISSVFNTPTGALIDFIDEIISDLEGMVKTERNTVKQENETQIWTRKTPPKVNKEEEEDLFPGRCRGYVPKTQDPRRCTPPLVLAIKAPSTSPRKGTYYRVAKR